MPLSPFEAVRGALVAHVEAGASLPDAARAVGIGPSTLKRWITRGRKGEEPYSEFVGQLEGAREQARARPGALTEDEFRTRLEESVRAGSVSAMTLWAKLYHAAGDSETEEPRSMVDELARRRRERAS